MHYGMQLTNLNPAELVFRQFINESSIKHYDYGLSDSTYRLLWSVILNVQMAGTVFGALPLVKLSEKLGRRKTFYVSSSFTLIGLLFQSISKLCVSYELLAAGRFLTGVGCGLASPLESMYLNEISPVHLRGFFCSMIGIFVEMGFIIGGILSLPVVFGTTERFPWMFVFEIPPILILLCSLPFLHESPRFLLARGRTDDCLRSLIFFGHENVEASMSEIESEIRSQETKTSWREIWEKIYLRRATWLGMLVVLMAAASGISAIDYFSTNILVGVGMTLPTAQYASVGIFVQCFISAMLGSFLIEKVGRRTLLLSTTFVLILMNTSLMVLSIIYGMYGVKWAGYLSVASCMILGFTFGIGPSILQWTVSSEMVPQNARSTVQLFVMLTQKIAAIIAGATFFPLQGAVGPFAFLLYVVPLAVFFIIFIRQFPETKKKTIVEVMQSLGYKGDVNIFETKSELE